LSSPAVQQPVPAAFSRSVRAWIPTLVWLCVLALFSSDTFSAEHTGSVLTRILHALFGRISAHQFQQIHFLVRKTAHFVSYGALGAFAFFSWRATFPAPRPWKFLWAALGLLTAFAGGSLDEFHQGFVSSRTSTFHDVLIDTAGALFFQLAIAVWISWKDGRASQ
jgi:VanZ family protein